MTEHELEMLASERGIALKAQGLTDQQIFMLLAHERVERDEQPQAPE